MEIVSCTKTLQTNAVMVNGILKKYTSIALFFIYVKFMRAFFLWPTLYFFGFQILKPKQIIEVIMCYSKDFCVAKWTFIYVTKKNFFMWPKRSCGNGRGRSGKEKKTKEGSLGLCFDLKFDP